MRTASGARAVQIVYSNKRGARDLEHIGSAHTDAEYELLLVVARQKLLASHTQLDLGLEPPAAAKLRITGSRMGVLWDLLESAYARLGFASVVDAADEDVFRRLVLARIIEPTSKLDASRVLEEAGIPAPSYATIKRRLPTYATPEFRQKIAARNAAHVGLVPATLVLYDVTTLYFETHEGDGFRESGFSKERRLEPQITVGLLADQNGFPLMVEAFEGNRAETTTMLPVIRSFMAAHHLQDVVVVADAGMVSDSNKKLLEAEGLSFVLGAKTPHVPSVITQWRKEHPAQQIPDGHVFTQPWPAGPTDKRRDHVLYYRYKADNARRTLHGIDQQILKAEAAVAGRTPVKRNRFLTLTGATKTVNRELEQKARDLAGIKAYVTNLIEWTPEQVIAAYHQLYQVEKSFRMSKSDLRARPIFHHKHESIDAHLTIVFTALAVSRLLEAATGWSIRKLVKTLRRYRTVQIKIGDHTATAEDQLPDDLATIINPLRTK